MHLSRGHAFSKLQVKEYYDLYYRKDDEGYDPFTGNETRFIGLTRGYSGFDGSDESNVKKIASSTIEYWVKVKGYSEDEAINYLNDKHKRSAENANKTKKKLMDENPDRRFLGGYSIKKYELMGCSYKDAKKKYEEVRNKAVPAIKNGLSKVDWSGKRKGQIEYWVNKGYTSEEAKLKVKEVQSTFTLKKCIEKYGEEEGIKIFTQRQEMWSNKVEEKYKNGEFTRFCKHNWSKTELDFIGELVKALNINDDEYYSAFNGKQFCRNFKDIGKTFAYDFVYMEKIIEFNGDYWHCNPQIYEAEYFNKLLQCTSKEKWELDKYKNSLIENEGYKVLVIWESEWLTNPKQTIEKCIKFINKD
jgi:hypothetical protein